MKASELRIGNYAIDELTGELLKVALICDDERVEMHVVDRSKFPLPDGWKALPIPLTEEWLLKFGFEKSGLQDHLWVKDWFMIGKNALDIYRFETPSDRIGIGFQHVHQLQNLYFTLTGTELTIKE